MLSNQSSQGCPTLTAAGSGGLCLFRKGEWDSRIREARRHRNTTKTIRLERLPGNDRKRVCVSLSGSVWAYVGAWVGKCEMSTTENIRVHPNPGCRFERNALRAAPARQIRTQTPARGKLLRRSSVVSPELTEAAWFVGDHHRVSVRRMARGW